ncbi:SGNH/GDSL hydrolase family protein [Sphingomonas sp. CFBP 8765]|uniref:SGNH/GDSL hydrolase family protein n=2 Tax=unclassified Sphingomonas TaxID=196159 RepID=UPI00177B8EF0|nr:SGNH/GDSL hydrolase family protein [Sphingomonas sp. CFBP 8765]MBD8471187.1 SGNH/GDSL hydrolase family protein [Sphingomonas sp. CFBP 8765]
MAVLTNIPNNTSARDWRDTVNSLLKRIAALEAAGVPVVTPAPAFTTQPSITPTSGTAGSTLYAATPGTVSNGSVVSRVWLLNGTAISSGVTALPASSGTLAYQETASGPGGTTTSTVQVAAVTAATVTPTPAPSFTSQPSISPNTGTAGTTTFTATAGNVSNGSITARSWTINGTVISTGITAAPASSGTLTYQETATGSGGTTQSTVQQVTVATAVAAAPAFTSQPTVSPSTGTAGNTTYTATPGAVSNGTITFRAWALNGSTISTGLTAAPASAGTLTYQEFATGSGGTASSSVLTRPVSAAAPAPSPALSLSSAVAKAEGNSGTTLFSWTLTLNRDGSTAAYPFTWSMAGSGANPADAADFGGAFPAGSGTFAGGETSKTISALVAGDTAVEPDDTFTLTVVATGLNTVTSTGTISNDDTAAAVSKVQVGRRTFVANGMNAAYTRQNIRHYEPSSSSALVSGKWRIVVPNFYTNQGGGGIDQGIGAAVVTASIEHPSGTFTQITFSGGTVLNQASGDAGTESDPIGLNIPQGTAYYVRIYRQCAGGILISNYAAGPVAGNTELGDDTLADKTMSGTIAQTFSNQYWAPIAIVQDVDATTNPRTVAIFGDSKAWGANILGVNPGGGEIYPILVKSGAPLTGILHLAISGSQMQDFVAGNGVKRLEIAKRYARNHIIQWGINDKNSGARTGDQMIADRQTVMAMFPDPTRVWNSTVGVGNVSGTYGSYATQNVPANDVHRVTLNNWVRSLPRFIEVAKWYEDGDNTGRWLSPSPQFGVATTGNLTTDGTHQANTLSQQLVVANGTFDLDAITKA